MRKQSVQQVSPSPSVHGGAERRCNCRSRVFDALGGRHDVRSRQSSCGRPVLVTSRSRTEYLASAVILWVAIWIARSSTLDASAFDDMVPILGGGTFFFVVIIPAARFRRSGQPPPT
jgi:hypothetical protein